MTVQADQGAAPFVVGVEAIQVKQVECEGAK
jgi:hypothetical protein